MNGFHASLTFGFVAKSRAGLFSTRINAAKVFKGTYNRKFSSKTFHLQPQHCDDLIMAQKNKTLQNCGSSIAHYSCVSRRIIEGLMLAVQHFYYQAGFFLNDSFLVVSGYFSLATTIVTCDHSFCL